MLTGAEIQDLYDLFPELEVVGLIGTPWLDAVRLKRLEEGSRVGAASRELDCGAGC
jgi:hypothetical protein